ncbi:hypothetical protein D0T87_02405 [Bacteroides sp. 51]|nr:hypothetical protein [Bacteroides sp. 51]
MKEVLQNLGYTVIDTIDSDCYIYHHGQEKT